MLEVVNLSVAYGLHRALEGASMKVSRGEIVVILGANGAGKSSLLRAIGGTCEGSRHGDISLDGASIWDLPAHRIVEQGIAMVPEGRGVFQDLSVQENLLLGAYSKRARADEVGSLEQVLSLFPRLRERRSQIVRTMSGGEQQMVAIGRAMMSSPQILMLDEPSLGLSPLLCRELFQTLAHIRETGLGILLVEQNARQSLAIADRGYLLENGHVVGEGRADLLLNDAAVQKAYLGGAAGETAAPLAKVARPREQDPATTALEAARSAAESALAFISTGTGAHKRLRTDDIVAGGIDRLVRHAAEVSTDRPTTRSQEQRPTRPTLPRKPVLDRPYVRPDGELGVMLAEMERAAREALSPRRPTITNTDTGSHDHHSRNPDDLPEIEVWRPEPDIEIYRRRDGEMRRVKGD